MISSDVRRAIGRAVAAAGLEPADPRLRPTGTPGQYASSVAFAFSERPALLAARLATALADAPLTEAEPIARAEVTGPGFITITVPPEALARLPERIAAAGPACAASDALRGLTVPAPPPADPLTAPGWETAKTALATQLTARLAAAAGATLTLPKDPERYQPHLPGNESAVGGEDTVRSAPKRAVPHATGQRGKTEAATAPERSGRHAPGQRQTADVAAAVAFAGVDAVRFALARAIPGRPAAIDPRTVARHALDNPAYAVRYAHARAASGVRWAAIGGNSRPAAMGIKETAILLDALSWLPERVATAARRGRPDEFARYLEELAAAAIAALISPGDPGSARAPGTDRLSLAQAARTGLAAGLGLLGVSAPDRV